MFSLANLYFDGRKCLGLHQLASKIHMFLGRALVLEIYVFICRRRKMTITVIDTVACGISNFHEN